MREYNLFKDSSDFSKTGKLMNNDFTSKMDLSSSIPLTIDVAKVIGTIANVYRDMAISHEEQQTQREYIRQMAIVETKKIEANTKLYMAQLSCSHLERMGIIQDISYIISHNDIDPVVVKLVEILLGALKSDR